MGDKKNDKFLKTINSWANINLTWNMSSKWSMKGEIRLDLNKMKIVSQQYRFYNDLHWWEFMIKISFSRYYKGYYLLLNN